MKNKRGIEENGREKKQRRKWKEDENKSRRMVEETGKNTKLKKKMKKKEGEETSHGEKKTKYSNKK